MSLRDCVFGRRIAGFSLFGPNRSLTGHPALELIADFLGAALFERVRTSPGEKRARANDRQGLHLLILGSEPNNARARLKSLIVED
jgi:hypothetical protein